VSGRVPKEEDVCLLTVLRSATLRRSLHNIFAREKLFLPLARTTLLILFSDIYMLRRDISATCTAREHLTCSNLKPEHKNAAKTTTEW
jgi:hypothetical protein